MGQNIFQSFTKGSKFDSYDFRYIQTYNKLLIENKFTFKKIIKYHKLNMKNFNTH